MLRIATVAPIRNGTVIGSSNRIAATGSVTSGISSVVYETADAVQRPSANRYGPNRAIEPSTTRYALATQVSARMGIAQVSLAAMERTRRNALPTSIATPFVAYGSARGIDFNRIALIAMNTVPRRMRSIGARATSAP